MDDIKVTKAPEVTLIRRGVAAKGTLHLTTHHMIFRDDSSGREVWICYPIIADVERRAYNATIGHASLKIRCRDFAFMLLNFPDEQMCKDVFESMIKLTCVADIEKLYSFIYKPGSLERKIKGWKVYDPQAEYQRMGAFDTGKWRWTQINTNYKFSPTYPAQFVVPESISDNVLNYGVKFRSKARLPALSYYHSFNDCTITRCAQPMVGLKQNRSPQDEKIVSAIFNTNQVAEKIGATQDNLLVDARPTANAMAQTALGAGTENMDYYKGARKIYLGIDNIHVMRDSLNKVIEALSSGDVSPLPPNQELLHKSGWLKHLTILLEGSVLIAKQVHYNFSHVLLHCSDGWDRTAQVSSLAQICLDPYYRTIDGFITLIEKDWLSFGFRFAERAGHLSNEKHFTQVAEHNTNQAQQVFNSVSHKLVKQSHIKYTSPVFHQFLDCVYQIMRQYPGHFEFNERFLRRMLYHSYSCQYGTFLFNNEKERVEANASTRTRSAWDYFLARKQEFINKEYDETTANSSDAEILTPNAKDVKWWSEMFGRSDQDMNSLLNRLQVFDEPLSPSGTITTPHGGAATPVSPPAGSPAAQESSSSSALSSMSPMRESLLKTTSNVVKPAPSWQLASASSSDHEAASKASASGEGGDGSATSPSPERDSTAVSEIELTSR